MTMQLRNVIGPFFHVFVCLHHIYAIIYSNKKKDFSDVTDQRVLDMETFAPVFFTSWNIIIQTIYFILALWYDVMRILSIKEEQKKKVLLYKGYIFTSLVFPCSLFVSTMFWGVYSLNREWVLPEVLDKYFPEWLNHSLHTNILVFLVIEVLIVNQLLPTFKSAFIGLSIVFAIYHLTFLVAYFASGRWAYGLFYIFTWPERIAFIFSNYLFAVFVMKMGIQIQNFKNNLTRPASSENIKKCVD